MYSTRKIYNFNFKSNETHVHSFDDKALSDPSEAQSYLRQAVRAASEANSQKVKQLLQFHY